LIKQGAKLVEAAKDVIDELVVHTAVPASTSEAPDLSGISDVLLDAMGYEPATLDALQARTGLPTPELSARLLTLELDGHVARLPGGNYQRRSAA
jgi:DNA processing protein